MAVQLIMSKKKYCFFPCLKENKDGNGGGWSRVIQQKVEKPEEVAGKRGDTLLSSEIVYHIPTL